MCCINGPFFRGLAFVLQLEIVMKIPFHPEIITSTEIGIQIPKVCLRHLGGNQEKDRTRSVNMATGLHIIKGRKNETKIIRRWQNNIHKTLMVVAILLTTMAFQVRMTPTDEVWQDDIEGG